MLDEDGLYVPVGAHRKDALCADRMRQDDKYELRLSMYLENHEKLKQLYAEEKDYSFSELTNLLED